MQKIKISRKIENKYILPELLSDKSLEAINRVFGTYYARPRQLKKRDRTFNFFKKLMKQKTGVR